MSIADLDNKIVFITGAGAGIGLESVKAFADANCTVIATDVSAPALEALAADVVKRGQRCHTYQLDVADREAYLALAAQVLDEVGCPKSRGQVSHFPQIVEPPPKLGIGGEVYLFGQQKSAKSG